MKHTIPLFTALLLAPLAALRSADPPDTNYDESKVPSSTLPEALVCFDGQAVEDAKRWREKRRPEILRAFAENVEPPPTPGLRRVGSRRDEKGNSCYGVGQVGKWKFPPGLGVLH
jgi:hypothetical protein